MVNAEALTLVTVEVSQILKKLVSVAYQNINDWTSLVGVCNKHLQASNIKWTQFLQAYLTDSHLC